MTTFSPILESNEMGILERLWLDFTLFNLQLLPWQKGAVSIKGHTAMLDEFTWPSAAALYLPDPLDLNEVLFSPVPLILKEATNQKKNSYADKMSMR